MEAHPIASVKATSTLRDTRNILWRSLEDRNVSQPSVQQHISAADANVAQPRAHQHTANS